MLRSPTAPSWVYIPMRGTSSLLISRHMACPTMTGSYLRASSSRKISVSASMQAAWAGRRRRLCRWGIPIRAANLPISYYWPTISSLMASGLSILTTSPLQPSMSRFIPYPNSAKSLWWTMFVSVCRRSSETTVTPSEECQRQTAHMRFSSMAKRQVRRQRHHSC